MSVHKSADTRRTRALPHELIPRQSFPPGECIALSRAVGAGHGPPSDTTQNLILISPALQGPRSCRRASREQKSPTTRSLHHRGCWLWPPNICVCSRAPAAPQTCDGACRDLPCTSAARPRGILRLTQRKGLGWPWGRGGKKAVLMFPDIHFGNPTCMWLPCMIRSGGFGPFLQGTEGFKARGDGRDCSSLQCSDPKAPVQASMWKPAEAMQLTGLELEVNVNTCRVLFCTKTTAS